MSQATPQTVLETARGFMEPRILLTAAELDLFTLLARDCLTAAEVAHKVGGDLRAVTILLDATAAMGLLTREGERYRCEPPAAAALSADSPDSVLPMVLHAAVISQRWARLREVALGGEATYSEDVSWDDEADLRSFIGAMHVVGRGVAPAIVAAIEPGDARRLLDVGGASGTYTITFLEASPDLTATLFDRPPVIEMARERLAAAGLLDRVTLAPGDFYEDELPGGHDLALLSAIIHQNSPEQNIELYSKVYRALAPSGRIVIRDHVLSPDRTSPRGGAVFAVNMLVNTPGGNSYTYDEIRDGLTTAGFTRIRLVQPDERMDGIVEGFRPGEGP